MTVQSWLAADRILSPLCAIIVGVLVATADMSWGPDLQAAGTDFAGTVLMVDPQAGKLVVKKDSGGTRFTFVVNDQTQFEGTTHGLKDLHKGDVVTVQYQVRGQQYVAVKITPMK